MPDGSSPLLVAIILLVVMSAFFSFSETAFSSLNEIKLKSLSQNDKRVKNTLKLYENFEQLLTTVLIGNNIVNLTASALSLEFFILILKGNTLDATTVSTIAITLIVLFFGEVAPKFIAKSYPEKSAMLVCGPIRFFYYIFYPFAFVLICFQKLIGKIFRIKKEDSITDEELITIVNEAEEDGTLKEEESNLIKSAIEFDDLEVKDILTPRMHIVAIDVEGDLQDIKKTVDSERYSRLPVYKGNIDSIVGFIHEKDFYRKYGRADFTIKDILQEVVYVVEYTKISTLLKKMQAKKIQMAVVLDEYGGTVGIVTMEDILEELVGEIYDEYDEEEAGIIANDDGTVNVKSSVELDDFFEYFGISSDEDENFDALTVGGFITELLGEIPYPKKSFTYKNLQITVLKSTRKKLLEVRVKVLEEEENKE